MREHFKAFDFLRTNTSLIGEMIWNFADFMTAQGEQERFPFFVANNDEFSLLIFLDLDPFPHLMIIKGLTRVTGNRKGIFTRERQPKASAHYLRKRYHLLAQQADAFPLPKDLGHEIPIYTH